VHHPSPAPVSTQMRNARALTHRLARGLHRQRGPGAVGALLFDDPELAAGL